jgi:hypothetical protein
MDIFLIITGAFFVGVIALITWALEDQAPWNRD